MDFKLIVPLQLRSPTHLLSRTIFSFGFVERKDKDRRDERLGPRVEWLNMFILAVALLNRMRHMQVWLLSGVDLRSAYSQKLFLVIRLLILYVSQSMCVQGAMSFLTLMTK